MNSCVMANKSSSGSSNVRRNSTTKTSWAGVSVVLSLFGQCERSCMSSRPRHFRTVATVTL